MIKDITLGQFFPGNSIVHRIDPRMKLILTMAYIVILFVAKETIPAYGLMLLLNVLVIALSRLHPRMILRGLKPMIFILIFTAVLNMLYIPGDELVSFWRFTITEQGIETAAFMVVRILLLVTITFQVTYTTSPMMLTDAMESLLGPLKKLRVPVHELAMMMTIALRMIPTLIEETDKIMSAQKARGADFESGHLLSRAKALIPILVPLFISAFRRAEELAMAMECRCYHGGEGRTRLRQLKATMLDFWVLLFCTLYFAAVISTRFFL